MLSSLPRRQPGGFILIVVLSILVLIAVLVVGFLAHAGSQAKASASYRDQTGTLLLGDVAVNLVKAQVDIATANAVAGTAAAPGAGLWASQPGAIRLVDSTGTQSTYKLYSSPTLTISGTGSPIAGDLPASTAATANDWTVSPVWTDLNAPTKRVDGTYAYPIIDAVNDPADLPAGGTSAPPFTVGSFNIDNTNTVGATRTAGTSTTPVPMPVQWLYVLKQGQIIAPDPGSTGSQVTFNNSANAMTKPVSTPSNPTTDNPIVGRIAFWTDDDTCRVNINTASYGTFWDTPRFTSPDDYTFALDQPVYKEYQRYPGHAAMTTLALALPEFGGVSPTTANAEALHGLSPRYYPNGSTEGTVQTFTALGSPAKTDRLYASVEELLFSPAPTSQGVRPASAYLNKNQVEAAKFFLTAQSRAPELNLFGKPRVAIWPISSLNNTGANLYRTATDQLIAFCSTTPATTPNPYYFTRVPFSGGAGGSNSSTMDVSLPRNVQLLSYLDTLTAQSIPGNLSNGVSFDSKYTQLGMRQILTEIFDYIRITNTRDPLLDPTVATSPVGMPYAAANSLDTTNGLSGDGQILPTYYGTYGTYGYGRFSGRLIEASLVFVGVGKGITAGTTSYNTTTFNYDPVPAVQAATSPTYTVANGSAVMPPGTSSLVPPPGDTAVQAFLALSFFDPALGWSRANPAFNVTITGSGLSGLTLNGTNLGFQTGTVQIGQGQSPVQAQLDSERPGALGGMMDFRVAVAKRQFARATGTTNYPFYSNIVNVANSSLMNLAGGGLVTINIYPVGQTSGTPIHSYTVDFSQLPGSLSAPGFSMRPIFGTLFASGGGTRPYLDATAAAVANSQPPTVPATPDYAGGNTTDRFDDWQTDYADANGDNICNMIDTGDDAVLSLVPTGAYGDYRMLAGNASAVTGTGAGISATLNTAVTFNGNHRWAYGFEYGGGQVWRGSQHGVLVKGATYFAGSYTTPTAGHAGPGTGGNSDINPTYESATPLVPYTVQGASAGSATYSATQPPPDYDNGFGDLPDGPYINKPDEGVVYPANNTAGGNGGVARPYYDNRQETSQTSPQAFFSPQRQVPSPVMFGSLPTGAPVGALPATPWQTLLFQPGISPHKGLLDPKDEYLLDLFWMPQAEPYAISEPFSTAGKVNLNYQILPFTYIDRSTAIQSVLSSEKVAQMATSQAGVYKDDLGNNVGTGTNARISLNLSEYDGTLRQFAQKFSTFDFFKTPAEICGIYLVPQGQSWTSDSSAQSTFYGSAFGLVGDNTREKPYADIYSRITTKSNSFTVYYRVQALKNTPGASNAAQWTEGTGAILGDYRGYTKLERYIDPNDTTIPDYATSSSAVSLDSNVSPAHYKWRVVGNSRFAP